MYTALRKDMACLEHVRPYNMLFVHVMLGMVWLYYSFDLASSLSNVMPHVIGVYFTHMSQDVCVCSSECVSYPYVVD